MKNSGIKYFVSEMEKSAIQNRIHLNSKTRLKILTKWTKLKTWTKLDKRTKIGQYAQCLKITQNVAIEFFF